MTGTTVIRSGAAAAAVSRRRRCPDGTRVAITSSASALNNDSERHSRHYNATFAVESMLPALMLQLLLRLTPLRSAVGRSKLKSKPRLPSPASLVQMPRREPRVECQCDGPNCLLWFAAIMRPSEPESHKQGLPLLIIRI
jgi:hypothetical protein